MSTTFFSVLVLIMTVFATVIARSGQPRTLHAKVIYALTVGASFFAVTMGISSVWSGWTGIAVGALAWVVAVAIGLLIVAAAQHFLKPQTER